MVARGLAAQADLRSSVMRGIDHRPDHPLDRLVLLVEELGEVCRIAIDSESELRQIIAADRKSVEALRELPGKDHVRRNLAHDVDLQAVLATAQTVLRHDRKNPVS